MLSEDWFFAHMMNQHPKQMTHKKKVGFWGRSIGCERRAQVVDSIKVMSFALRSGGWKKEVRHLNTERIMTDIGMVKCL